METNIFRYISGLEFLEHAKTWLLESEAENNVILGVARAYQADNARHELPAYWASVHSENHVVGCAFRTPPGSIVVTQMPADAVLALIKDVEDVYSALPGVNGPNDPAELFAKNWVKRHKKAVRIKMRMRIHKLTQVTFPTHIVDGKLRMPLDKERPLIREWASAFKEEAGAVGDPIEAADKWLNSGRVFIWDHEGPCCLVASGRESDGGAAINAVYTPPQFRRRGYASIAVATVSQRLLDGGKRFCCLYTDLNNPTANSIYRQIGYRAIRDDVDIEFVD